MSYVKHESDTDSVNSIVDSFNRKLYAPNGIGSLSTTEKESHALAHLSAALVLIKACGAKDPHDAVIDVVNQLREERFP
jgi:hypothetical protein